MPAPSLVAPSRTLFEEHTPGGIDGTIPPGNQKLVT